jgi:hypothetical protein
MLLSILTSNSSELIEVRHAFQITGNTSETRIFLGEKDPDSICYIHAVVVCAALAMCLI